ncbi:uncharacterized protein PFL1_05823 [Pseudozyma flocculosa PF-1]|uniref:Uncharacterized protein n=1 Tax=Pseudozyma flocculosa PF-1 TaxID=1277687 RepID=A0A061H7G5_9BASI|nr:uncharacterized protein PFL1_05823 [Pseudozyma flocculosa PF-1]EPQ26501.1 hypothetical protein PFL1_05823 [Pseudozyma flocculosa PF-1]
MTLTEPPTSNLSSSLTVGRVFGDQRGARREGEREWSVDQRQLSEPPASECARGATTVRVRPSVRRTKDGRRHRFISRLGTRRRLRVDGYMNGRTGLAAIQPPSDVRRGTMERQCVATYVDDLTGAGTWLSLGQSACSPTTASRQGQASASSCEPAPVALGPTTHIAGREQWPVEPTVYRNLDGSLPSLVIEVQRSRTVA